MSITFCLAHACNYLPLFYYVYVDYFLYTYFSSYNLYFTLKLFNSYLTSHTKEYESSITNIQCSGPYISQYLTLYKIQTR